MMWEQQKGSAGGGVGGLEGSLTSAGRRQCWLKSLPAARELFLF